MAGKKEEGVNSLMLGERGTLQTAQGAQTGPPRVQDLTQTGLALLAQPQPCADVSCLCLSQEEPWSQRHCWSWHLAPSQLSRASINPCSPGRAELGSPVLLEHLRLCRALRTMLLKQPLQEWAPTKQASLPLEHCQSILINVTEFIVSNGLMPFPCLMYYLFIKAGFISPVSVTPSLPWEPALKSSWPAFVYQQNCF